LVVPQLGASAQCENSRARLASSSHIDIENILSVTRLADPGSAVSVGAPNVTSGQSVCRQFKRSLGRALSSLLSPSYATARAAHGGVVRGDPRHLAAALRD
jgi:hypothetical protein